LLVNFSGAREHIAMLSVIVIFNSYNGEESNTFYETLDEKLSHTEVIAVNWNKYKQSLIQSIVNNKVRIYATIDADYYFNVTKFSSGLALGFWQNFAGIFTGLGILGTFIGLTFGIYGIDMTTNSALQTGIVSLLKGAGTVFFTSVIGIILAILFSILHHNFFMKNFASDINSNFAP
jgi:AAA+ ATPase superfamily predicted ATPase